MQNCPVDNVAVCATSGDFTVSVEVEARSVNAQHASTSECTVVLVQGYAC